ncbi:hypothetical protein HXX02_13160 [Microbulbifer elongatus]|uniref:Uncharacterized protein n=1 Tax=Microbulbifer elongatus TaxID=86173 RepID=A0ABT1P2Q3_9GAMM|nr:hypothetical protein [Microbulbifer elongatus]MCQ3830397.1 hypothetical protein [Microbulbifer elongatus]
MSGIIPEYPHTEAMVIQDQIWPTILIEIRHGRGTPLPLVFLLTKIASFYCRKPYPVFFPYGGVRTPITSRQGSSGNSEYGRSQAHFCSLRIHNKKP